MTILMGVVGRFPLALAAGLGEIHPLLYGVAALFVIYFLRGPIEALVY